MSSKEFPRSDFSLEVHQVANSPLRTVVAEIVDSPRRNNCESASNNGRETSCRLDGPSLALVVLASQRGDRVAQRQLYDCCHPNVFRLMVRMVGRQEAAEAMQQVFLQVFRSIDQFNGHSHFVTWLYRLAVNEALQHLRRNRRKYRTLDWEPVDDSRQTDGGESKELLDLALARIDSELRSIFLLREVEGLSYRDISDALQIREGTVGSRLNRARRELKQHLSDLGFEPS
jgi:RNA polymerase sigma-70 factor (ECF subfamily)